MDFSSYKVWNFIKRMSGRQPGPEEWYCISKVANWLWGKNNDKTTKTKIYPNLQTSKQKLYLSFCFYLAQVCFSPLNPFWLKANEYKALTKKRFKFVPSVLNIQLLALVKIELEWKRVGVNQIRWRWNRKIPSTFFIISIYCSRHVGAVTKARVKHVPHPWLNISLKFAKRFRIWSPNRQKR